MLLLASMTAVLVTGLLISKTLPTAMAGTRGLQMWHYFFAAAALVLSGIHLGLHGAYLKNNLWKKLPLPIAAGKAIGAILLCGLFCLGSFQLVASGFASQFTRPFVRMPFSQEGQHPAFEEMEHATGSGKGMGEGMGNGMGREKGGPGGMGQGKDGPGHGMNQPPQGISMGNAISTFTTYASILCAFAIVTAFLSGWFQKQFHTAKPTSDA